MAKTHKAKCQCGKTVDCSCDNGSAHEVIHCENCKGVVAKQKGSHEADCSCGRSHDCECSMGVDHATGTCQGCTPAPEPAPA